MTCTQRIFAKKIFFSPFFSFFISLSDQREAYQSALFLFFLRGQFSFFRHCGELVTCWLTAKLKKNILNYRHITNMTKSTGDDVAPTEMLYLTYQGNFQMECNSKVLQCQFIDEEQKMVQLCLDKTVMHAQGGGQPTDVGSLSIVNGEKKQAVTVNKVLIDRSSGVATHSGTIVGGVTLSVGDDVVVSVDAENRKILSECHTAGHVVDSAMARCDTLLPPTKGYHFLDGPYVEYRGIIPADERPALLEKLQAAFQELLEEDIDTKIQILPKAEAEEICNRVAENFFNMSDYGDETVRIVTVAGWPCPCGGTHVKSTGLLKERKWNITGIKVKKDVVRIKYGYEK
jgi:Ser-tRNA(Ala) deacylase AlaX